MAFPESALPIVLEFLIDDAWVDFTRLDDDTRLLGPDGTDGLTIARGAQGEQRAVAPTSLAFRYLDNNATLDGDNPANPYYRRIGQNTQCRLTVAGEVACVVELSALRAAWTKRGDGGYVTIVPITAGDILHRLEQGKKPLKSAAYRAITSVENNDTRVAYWPLEESDGATRVSSPYVAGLVTISGEVVFGSHVGNPATERMPTFGEGGKLTFPIPPYSSSDTTITAQVSIPAGDPGEIKLMRFICNGSGIDFIDLVFDRTSSESVELWMKFYNGSTVTGPTLIFESFPVVVTAVPIVFAIDVSLEDDSGDLASTLAALTYPIAQGETALDIQVGVVSGQVTSIVANFDGTSGVSIGQVAVASSAAGFSNYVDIGAATYGASGYQGEPAAVRIERLATEEGIPFVLRGLNNLDGSAMMGAQTARTLYALLAEAADTDQGLLFGTRTELGITYITQQYLATYGVVAAADLTYATDVSPPFDYARDDFAIRNDISATRPSGGNDRFAIPDGDPDHYTTQTPVEFYRGVNPYDEAPPSNLAADIQLVQWAAWYAHMRAWAEKRVPALRVELQRAPLVASTTRTAAVRALDIGDIARLNATGTPAWVNADELFALIRGYTRIIGQYQDEFIFSTTPALPLDVEMVDTSGSVIVLAVDDNDTSVKLATTSGPAWATSGEPYYVEIDGDAMRVTNMVDNIPAFIAAGTASHAVNASVTPGLPAGMTIDTGQILLLKAAIRNSGTGVPNTPTGWTRIPVYATDVNIQWFYRYYATGYSGPTVSFTGGVAGADTSAQIYGFSGLSHVLDGTPVTKLNGSAANIAYDAFTAYPTKLSDNTMATYREEESAVFVDGWRQQDWTSVATLAGFTEIGEPDTGTGDNQGMVTDFLQQAIPTTVAAGSFVVTGGVNGISRSAVFALRALQTATVVRDINNAAASHAVGDSARIWRLGVIGL